MIETAAPPEAPPRLSGVDTAVSALTDELDRIGQVTDPVRCAREAAAATEQIRDAMNDVLARSSSIRSAAVRRLYEDSRPAPDRRGNWTTVARQIGVSAAVASRIGTTGRAGGRRRPAKNAADEPPVEVDNAQALRIEAALEELHKAAREVTRLAAAGGFAGDHVRDARENAQAVLDKLAAVDNVEPHPAQDER